MNPGLEIGIHEFIGQRQNLLEFPLNGTWEVVLNALIRMDYSWDSLNQPVLEDIYIDWDKVISPDTFYHKIKFDQLGNIQSLERNLVLANMLGRLHPSKTGCSGISKIYRLMKIYKFPEQEFTENKRNFEVAFRRRI